MEFPTTRFCGTIFGEVLAERRPIGRFYSLQVRRPWLCAGQWCSGSEQFAKVPAKRCVLPCHLPLGLLFWDSAQTEVISVRSPKAGRNVTQRITGCAAFPSWVRTGMRVGH